MRKALYLLRHAKSSWDDLALADHDRPLASRGRRASRIIAAHLQKQQIMPRLVLCSSATRARGTLERVGAGFDQDTEVVIEEGLYAASAGDLLDRLRAVRPRVESVMLIGHEPAMKELALALAGSGAHLERLREKFPTGALATLAFHGSWGELGAGAGELVAFVTPRELKRSCR